MNVVFLGIVGWQELLVVALILLLFFGGTKIPELMRSLGRGVKEFKEGMNEVTNIDDEPKKKEAGRQEVKEEVKEEKK